MIRHFGFAAAGLLFSSMAWAQAPATNQPFAAGTPLGVMADGQFKAMSANVKVYGAFNFAESCSYDEGRGLILVPSRGAAQHEIANDGYVSLINHDGSVHTAKWIGVNRNGLTLNNPLGGEVHNGVYYLADVDGGLKLGEPTTAVIRKFDLKSGAPAGDIKADGVPAINDVAVAKDGTIYGTQTGVGGDKPEPNTWKVIKITSDGKKSEFVVGAPLFQPNGIAMDPAGNIVVVNIGSNDVITFSPAGKVVKTEKAVQPGNDGLVIMADGTKYVSSVRFGAVSRIRPGQPAEAIAMNVPSAASMCYDAGANQLVIPMNPNNAIALISLK
jgi:sugar lactone lactonase YvrE